MMTDAVARTESHRAAIAWLKEIAATKARAKTRILKLTGMPALTVKFRLFGKGNAVAEIHDNEGPATLSILSDGFEMYERFEADADCWKADLIEGVVLLPENLFYNTNAPGIILVLNRHKPEERRGQIMLVNASRYFVKEKPKNVLSDAGIDSIGKAWRAWESREKLSRVITLEDARRVDYNLSPSRFVDVGEKVTHRTLGEIVADLHDVRIERQEADKELELLLSRIGLNGGGR